MKDDNKTYWIIGLIILAALLYNYSDFFGISILSGQVAYFNKPINIVFQTTNFSNPTIIAFFNDVKLYEVLTYQENVTYTNATTNQTYTVQEPRTINQSIGYSKTFINGSYTLVLNNVNTEGLIKVQAVEGNHSEVQSIEVRRPFVNIKQNLPSLIDKGKQVTIEINTQNPQGDELEADSVDIEIYKPDNTKETIFLTKSGSKFTKVFNYELDGTYQFKIHPKKEGYTTKEFTVITSVTKEAGVHPIIYVWISIVVIFIILFLIKLARRKNVF